MTRISSSIRSTSATSPNGSESSFNLQGTSFAKSIVLGENCYFDNPKIQNPETVNFKNPSTGEIKSVRAADADAFSSVPEFKDYVRQDG